MQEPKLLLRIDRGNASPSRTASGTPVCTSPSSIGAATSCGCLPFIAKSSSCTALQMMFQASLSTSLSSSADRCAGLSTTPAERHQLSDGGMIEHHTGGYLDPELFTDAGHQLDHHSSAHPARSSRHQCLPHHDQAAQPWPDTGWLPRHPGLHQGFLCGFWPRLPARRCHLAVTGEEMLNRDKWKDAWVVAASRCSRLGGPHGRYLGVSDQERYELGIVYRPTRRTRHV